MIVAHPGWGESLFLKEVWPEAKLKLYCEFFYHARGADVGFDPEFLQATQQTQAGDLKEREHAASVSTGRRGSKPYPLAGEHVPSTHSR